MLTRQEQEISIVKTADEKEYSVYITDPKFIRKMKKIGVEPYKKEKIDVDTYGYFYKLNEKQISFRRERVLSDEAREKLRERMIKARENQK